MGPCTQIATAISDGGGARFVEALSVDISVDVDESLGPDFFGDTQAWTWDGRTQVSINVTWADPTTQPWDDTEFMLSTRVRMLPHVLAPSRCLPRTDRLFGITCTANRAYCAMANCGVRWQACDAPDVAAPVYIYAANGASEKFNWQLDGLSTSSPATTTLHLYRDNVVDMDAVQCALIKVGPTATVVADIAGAPPVLAATLARLRHGALTGHAIASRLQTKRNAGPVERKLLAVHLVVVPCRQYKVQRARYRNFR